MRHSKLEKTLKKIKGKSYGVIRQWRCNYWNEESDDKWINEIGQVNLQHWWKGQKGEQSDYLETITGRRHHLYTQTAVHWENLWFISIHGLSGSQVQGMGRNKSVLGSSIGLGRWRYEARAQFRLKPASICKLLNVKVEGIGIYNRSFKNYLNSNDKMMVWFKDLS